MGLEKANTVPTCPQANGDVPAKLDETLTFGFAHGRARQADVGASSRCATRRRGPGTSASGRRPRRSTSRSAASCRSSPAWRSRPRARCSSAIPTRTYRSALTKKGVPVTFDPIALAKELTFRGPKGERGDAEDLEDVTALFTTSMLGLSDIRYELEKGDTRWYDQRACADDRLQVDAREGRQGRAGGLERVGDGPGRHARRRRALGDDERLRRAQRRHRERPTVRSASPTPAGRLDAGRTRRVRDRRDHVDGWAPAGRSTTRSRRAKSPATATTSSSTSRRTWARASPRPSRRGSAG